MYAHNEDDYDYDDDREIPVYDDLPYPGTPEHQDQVIRNIVDKMNKDK